MILANGTTSAGIEDLTHAVDIFAFIEAKEIPSLYFETPYYLAPAPGGERVYAVLRETLQRTQKVGIAYVVIKAQRQLAALVPCGPVLVLNTLRWAGDTPAPLDLRVPWDEVEAVDVTEEELESATRLIDSMSKQWEVRQYGQTAFQEKVAMALDPPGEDRGMEVQDFFFEPLCEKQDELSLTDEDLRAMRGRGSHRTDVPAARRKATTGHRVERSGNRTRLRASSRAAPWRR